MALINPSLNGRNGQIWKFYCRGLNQEALAAKFGLTQQRISQIVNEVRNSIPQEERAEIVKQETELLRQLRVEVLELWDAAAAPMVSNGRLIEGVVDHAGRLAALARAESLTARLHRVHGLDAPQKLDLNVGGEEEATRKAAADALSHLHGGETDA
jgi:transcriptional regulator with XRE-family HTH domain